MSIEPKSNDPPSRSRIPEQLGRSLLSSSLPHRHPRKLQGVHRDRQIPACTTYLKRGRTSDIFCNVLTGLFGARCGGFKSVFDAKIKKTKTKTPTERMKRIPKTLIAAAALTAGSATLHSQLIDEPFAAYPASGTGLSGDWSDTGTQTKCPFSTSSC